jgi:hypothetical protein
MVVSYIRSDKYFDGVYDQQNIIHSYAKQKGLTIDQEFIDQTSQHRKLKDRKEATTFLRSFNNATVLLYDSWVLSSHIDDVIEMVTCQLKHGNTLHLIQPSVVIDQNSQSLLVLGLIDQLRQKLDESSKKAIGRPKGSRSSSKFDGLHDQIIDHLKAGKNVSEMARIFGVSRSSLKDYIESRELKKIAEGGIKANISNNGASKVIETISCRI